MRYALLACLLFVGCAESPATSYAQAIEEKAVFVIVPHTLETGDGSNTVEMMLWDKCVLTAKGMPDGDGFVMLPDGHFFQIEPKYVPRYIKAFTASAFRGQDHVKPLPRVMLDALVPRGCRWSCDPDFDRHPDFDRQCWRVHP